MKRSYLAGFMFFIALTLMGTTPAKAYENEINSVSTTIGGKIVASGKKLVAVIDFVDLQGSVTELGRFLAEEFSTAIAGSGKGFEVVDRANLKMILAEHKLSATGIIDPATARKLGQVAGVQALITGTITPFGDSVRLSVKVLDTETAKVISAASVNIAKTKAIEELLARGIESAPASSAQRTAAPGYSPPVSLSSPSVSSSNTKKIGELVITIKRITVANNAKVTVFLDIFNQADTNTGVGYNHARKPELTDEKGNVFVFAGGLPAEHPSGCGNNEPYHTLNAKVNNDLAIQFVPQDRSVTLKDIGNSFSLALPLVIGNKKECTSIAVSIMDIKPTKPK